MTVLRGRASLARSRWLAILLWGCLLVVAGCGSTSASPSPGGRLRIVATTTVFADIVRQIGGDAVDVTSILPSGVGPEDYEPRPDDARRIADADLVVSNGVGLDDFLDKLIQAAGTTGVDQLVLGDGIPTMEVGGAPNPHFWLDPSLVERFYVPAIRDHLTKRRPAAAADIAARATAYIDQLKALDADNARKVATLPEGHRKLVTFHDAFPYFAQHYGFELIGVVLQNPGQEPSASDLAALVAKVKAADVRAVFSEAQFDPKLARTLASEAGISEVVTTLYNDALGPSPADSYLGLMTWDIDEIVRALS